VVTDPFEIDLTELLDAPARTAKIFVTLGYGEDDVEQVPLIGNSDIDLQEASLVREVARIGVTTEPPVSQRPQIDSGGVRPCPAGDDARLTLAAITPEREGPITSAAIDLTVRCELGSTPASTHEVRRLKRRVVWLETALGAAITAALADRCFGRRS
jgi:hypothetical protein